MLRLSAFENIPGHAPASFNRLFSCLALLALACPPPLLAEDPEPIYEQYVMSTGIDLSRGAYQQSIDTKVLYAPFSISYERGPWLGKLTVPVLSVRGPGDPQDVDSNGKRGDRSSDTDSGVGDITLDLSYCLLYTSPSPRDS